MERRKKSCGTCRDRRISCDRELPECLQCVRSNRECKGYGIRLSWPKINDRKRSMVSNGQLARAKAYLTSSDRMIHASTRDVEIHYYLASSNFNLRSVPAVPKGLSWNPITSETDYSLVQYFESIASHSLTTVNEGSPDLRDVLVRIALSNSLPLSTAVLQSLLAFSSVHRYGLQLHATKLKASAISALVASAKSGVDTDQVILHVATLMLLCCFEIQQGSETPSQWLSYISSVKNVLRAAPLTLVQDTSDMGALIYWVSYHDVLAKFSLHHWLSGPSQSTSHSDFSIGNTEVVFGELVKIPSFGFRFPCGGMLKLVSEVFNMVLGGKGATSYEADQKNLLAVLEWKIRRDTPRERPICQPEGQESPSHELTLDAFQFSLFVYIERMLNKTPGQSAKLSSIIEKAMAGFAQLDMLDRQFPLLILGCEARSDEHRGVVLDLIARTEKRKHVRSLQGIKFLIQSLWTQDDLAEREIPYMNKMQAVFTSSAILPALV